MGFFTGSSTPGEHGIDTAYLDDYADYQGIRDQVRDYSMNIMGGQEPEGFANFASSIYNDEAQNLDRDYYGDPGNRSNSAFGLAAQQGAALGTGPKSTVAFQGKAFNELEARKIAARAAIQKARLAFMQQASLQAPQNLLGLAQGPRAVSSPYNIQPTSTPGFLSEVGSGLGKGLGAGIGGTVASAGLDAFKGFFSKPDVL
jgi:hypothetical protein